MSAISVIPSIGIPIEYLVNKSWIVSMYLFPFCVFGDGPTISMLIFFFFYLLEYLQSILVENFQ